MDSIIFDVDGTLWDSRQAVADSWNEAVVEMTGQHPGYTVENITYLFGKTMDDIARCLFPDEPSERQQEMGNRCFDAEERWLETHSGLFYDGVREGFRRLAERYPLFIVSNCQSGYIEQTMKHGELRPYVRDWLCFGDTGRGKAENLKQIIEKHGLKDPVYVGDTQGDLDACDEAGVPMVFAAYGLGKVNRILPAADSFPELTKLLLHTD